MKKLSDYKLLENNPFPAMDGDSIKRTAANIKRLPKMLELRPIVVDSNNIIQAGNKRFQALLLLGYKEVPDEWIVSAKNYTKKDLKELIILDNVKEGVWNLEILKLDFPEINLGEFNIEVPEIDYDLSDMKERSEPSFLKLSINFESVEEKEDFFKNAEKINIDGSIEEKVKKIILDGNF